VIEAFTKNVKAKVLKAKKLSIQDEVDQPVSFLNYSSEFVPRTALIRHRPWLIPIILPLTNIATNQIMHPDSHTKNFPDIIIPNCDHIPDHIDIPDSDVIPNSSPSSEIYFPVSDDHGSEAMDVDRSNQQEMPISVASTKSE
jgi:hypothetical protein